MSTFIKSKWLWDEYEAIRKTEISKRYKERYHNNEEYKEYQKEYQKKYRGTPEWKKAYEEYQKAYQEKYYLEVTKEKRRKAKLSKQ